MTANMQIKGKAATPALREKLRFLIKNESSYPISENLIERLIDMGTIICLHSGEPIVSAGDVAPDFYKNLFKRKSEKEYLSNRCLRECLDLTL